MIYVRVVTLIRITRFTRILTFIAGELPIAQRKAIGAVDRLLLVA